MITTDLYILETGCRYEGGSAIGIFDYDTGRKKAFELAQSIIYEENMHKLWCANDMKEEPLDIESLKNNIVESELKINIDTEDKLFLLVEYTYISLERVKLNDCTQVDKKINQRKTSFDWLNEKKDQEEK